MDPIEKGAQTLKRMYFEHDGTVISDEEAKAEFQNLVDVFAMLSKWKHEDDEKKKNEEKEKPPNKD